MIKAAPDRVVKVTYELRTEPLGEVKDSADKTNPFAFLFGDMAMCSKSSNKIWKD